MQRWSQLGVRHVLTEEWDTSKVPEVSISSKHYRQPGSLMGTPLPGSLRSRLFQAQPGHSCLRKSPPNTCCTGWVLDAARLRASSTSHVPSPSSGKRLAPLDSRILTHLEPSLSLHHLCLALVSDLQPPFPGSLGDPDQCSHLP